MADEVVVVDTGSRDRTREIAREAGALLHDFPWNGNEADARNAALSHAAGEWLLTIDADEELSPELAEELRRELPGLAAGPAQALTVPLRNLYLHGAGSRSRIPRIGRAAPGFRFAGVIHPQPPYREPFHDLRGDLLHYGYRWTEEARRRKGSHLLDHLSRRTETETMPLRHFCEALTALLIAGEAAEFARLWPLWRSFPAETRQAGPEALAWSHALGNALIHFAARNDLASGAEAARETIARHPRHFAAARYMARAAVAAGDWERVSALTEPFGDFSFAAADRSQRIPDDAEPALRAWRWLAGLRREPPPPVLAVPPELWRAQLLPVLWRAEEERPGAAALPDALGTALLRLRSRLDSPSPENDGAVDRLTQGALERQPPASAPFLAALVARFHLNLRLGPQRRRENLGLMDAARRHHGALGWLGTAFPRKPEPFGEFVKRALERI